MNEYIERIKEKGITKEIVLDMISDHEKEHKRMKTLYERYKAADEAVPIKTRGAAQYETFDKPGSMKRIDDKVNNRLSNPFDVDIVDTKIGYFLGHPINYDYDDKRDTGETSPIKDAIDTFNLRNHVEDEDSELGKMATICGQGARLAYIDKEGNERIKNIDPWQVIFLGDKISEPDYSLRYYKNYEGHQVAEFYDDRYTYYFNSDDKGDLQEQFEKKSHVFACNPLFGLANNKELLSDAERVLALIDAYDRTLSDASNEIEQYRLAYLVLKGLGADEDTLKEIKKTGIMELFDKEDSVDYLTKDINDSLIEHHLDRLENNIIKLAKSVDFDDETFGTAISGVAMKFKLMSLENKCITMERKFTSTLRYQYKVIFSAWSKRKSVGKDDYLKVKTTFKRNIPVNLLEESQIAGNLRGNVSERTRLAQLSFVNDVDYELEEMQREQDEFDARQEPLGGEDNEPTRD